MGDLALKFSEEYRRASWTDFLCQYSNSARASHFCQSISNGLNFTQAGRFGLTLWLGAGRHATNKISSKFER